MLKKLLAVFVFVVCVSSTALAEAPAYSGYPVVNVMVNGTPLASDVPSILMDGRTWVPLKAVAESLGAEVSFDPSMNTASVQGANVTSLREQITELQHDLNLAQSQQADVANLYSRLSALEERLSTLERSNTAGSASVAAIYEQVKRSIVGLTVFKKNPQGRTSMATGTGVVAWRNAEKTEVQIATNMHVIQDATDIYVVTNDGALAKGTVWSTEGDLDYAVIKVTGSDLPEPISWGLPDSVKVGDPVILVGNPLGYRNSVSTGVLSGRSHLIDNNGYEFLQTDAAASPGSSGGAMLDAKGNWIGMITLKPTAPGAEGMTFAISLNAIRKSVEISNRNGQNRAYLGAVFEQNYAATAGAKTTAGVTIRFLDPAGPLARAGFLVGDEIQIAGKRTLGTLADLRSLVDDEAPGTQLHVIAVRGVNNFGKDLVLGTVYMTATKPVLRYVQNLSEDQGAF